MTPSPDGFLPLDKPTGPTSHDMVATARRALGIGRIGHTGTLDPFASGLLLLAVGRATRLVEYLHPLPKEYRAEALFGVATATDDPEGEVVAESGGWSDVTADRMREVLATFQGDGVQLPPVYSAKKVDGEAAHRRTRRGEEVRLEPVPIRIHELELLQWEPPRLHFRVLCSTGTYVRALARDFAAALGTHAHLTALRRTRIGPFPIDRAIPTKNLEEPDRVADAWISPLAALAHLPAVQVDDTGAVELEAGRPVPVGSETETGEREEGTPVVVAVDGHLLAIAERRGTHLHPRKVFPRA